ncbi:MAG: GntR family transcriptional regulator [Oscillospiraceae bacterium]|nr:GntR family transcriptional regulator [Oscillospiraceae bacterium]
MISFDNFTMVDGSPIYQQIILHIKRGVIAGTIADGDELPSRRVLSALLGVNPNTVQKAYKMLEDEGLIASHSGAKSCMVLTADTVRSIKLELVAADARTAVRALRQMGISLDEAREILEKYWEGEEEQ